MPQSKTKIFTAHIPIPLAEKVNQMAARLTQEALADVDAGNVIDHQAVQAWAESLNTDSPLPTPK